MSDDESAGGLTSVGVFFLSTMLLYDVAVVGLAGAGVIDPWSPFGATLLVNAALFTGIVVLGVRIEATLAQLA
jgi:hypothetical protein